MSDNTLFLTYVQQKSENTLIAQRTDLAAFLSFLEDNHYTNTTSIEQMQLSAAAWQSITWQIVQSFVEWQLAQGHAISSINRRLSTIRTYAKLAAKAGDLAASEYAMITTITGYSSSAAKRIDAARSLTRTGDKKSEPVKITDEQARQLKTHPDTPQGRRDRLLMCLLLDHGLRISEIVLLQVQDFDADTGLLYFERPNLDDEQVHKLSPDTRQALQASLRAGDCLPRGPLLRGSRKNGKLTHAGISDQAIQARVRFLGEQIGLLILSPNDCRHYWATYWAKKVDVLRLQEAGGWSSLDMPRRYIERAKIANLGMTEE